ncbi:DNA-3-methyladenine glycosylase I [Corynebacterium pseudotuberculosis]|uniref:DNA-3-methyladenine glycosylase I n=1 Tax=Corynebacterium pseudotuberculosis TaxID=1719 RepID=UPI0002660C16|nr:DNA-3-methyladenine glycosylase I [Corynebacterium pseudotuberculosis]AFM06471.1 DNA-3-methyladenine glycosylase I [Corynebacterium pseudotuberculosis Cp162]APG80815.1 DNA-3-methyladenine glycosylase 1 [Corynebacterium pseudotuberculosis]WFP67297.1 DNA-3-methyladenine glycosylase I [Corynebacterium pseudotuberculosis]
MNTSNVLKSTPLSTDLVLAEGLVVGEDGRVRPEWAAKDPLLRKYYDYEWGRPVHTESGLLERLSLEAFQSGLSWATVLRKRDAFRAAFYDFDADTVARFGEEDIVRLLGCSEIIRNRRKIEAVITNARATIALRASGGLDAFIWGFAPKEHQPPATLADTPTVSNASKALAKALKKAGFTFIGPTTCYALSQAIGMIDDRPAGASKLLDDIADLNKGVMA